MNSRIARRRLLKLLAGSYLSLWCARASFAQSKSQKGGAKKKKIIVIGSGVSGLAAARELKSSGFEVMILEGQNRLGGRVYSNRSLGFPIDLGASWIHEERGNPITEIARKNGVKTVVHDDSWKYYSHDGRQIGFFNDSYVDSATAKLERAVLEYGKGLSSDISFSDAVERALRADPPDADERLFINSYLCGLETSSDADADKLSLLYGLNMDSLAGEDLLLPSGYDQIPKALSRGVDIRYGHVVSAINFTRKPVIVATNKGSFNADGVIVSVPLGVLKKKTIAFTPALPEDKSQAIDRMGFGLLNKVVLHFPKVFWPARTTTFGYVAKRRGEFPEFLNWYKFGKQPVLIGFVAGSKALELERLSDSEIVLRQMGVLKKIFGEAIPKPKGHLITRWASDSFAYGSYSHVPVGATDADYDILARPLPRLYFAGEATSRRFPATVHGAFFSGVRAAQEVQAAFG